MFLCVDATALRVDPKSVQKDVKIEEILKDHTKYFDSTEEAYAEDYVPIDFSVCVRSMYDNTVLQIEEDGKKLYYQNMTNTPPVIHKGYDLIMFMTSIGVMHFIDYADGFDKLMLEHSQFQCIGLYNPAPEMINPIVVSHVIMSDDGMKDLEKFFKKGVTAVPIESMQMIGNLKPILDTLIIVKEENKDE